MIVNFATVGDLIFALVGEAVMEKSGGSVAGLTVKESAAVPVPALLVALNWTLKPPDTEALPEMRPVLVLMDKPEGRPLAPKLAGLLVAVI